MSASDAPGVPLREVLSAEAESIARIRNARCGFSKGFERREVPPPSIPSPCPARIHKPAWHSASRKWIKTIKEAHENNYVALAFSGGGIRSATFNLGVLQALAELKLLHRIDYLSTVSGGGYIGSWLVAWCHREGRDDNGAPRRNAFARVQAALAPNRVHQEDDREPPPIRALRVFSNYLTPRLGLLGGDAWAATATILRNLLLNQAVLLAAISVTLLLPRVLVDIATITPNGVLLPLGVIALVIGLFTVSRNMRNLDVPEAQTALSRQGWVLAFSAGPVFATSAFVAVWRRSGGLELPTMVALGAIAYPVVWILATAAEWAWSRVRRQRRAGAGHPSAVPPRRFLAVLLGSVVAGAFGGWLYTLAWRMVAHLDSSLATKTCLTFGVPLTLGVLLLAGTLHIGLIGPAFHDSRREWWARLGGSLMIWGLGWLAVFATALYVQEAGGLVAAAVRRSPKWVGDALRQVLTPQALTSSWIVSTLAGVFAAKSRHSGMTTRNWRDHLAAAAPFVFVVGLVYWLAYGIDALLADRSGVPLYASLAGSVVVAGLLAWRVDVNEFSIHALYRNRLVRCYLGASNRRRSPNWFTGFDINDDLPLAKLTEDSYDGPYPVLNAALNLVKGQDLAWQERKAGSFVMTPIHSGFDLWLERQDALAAEGRLRSLYDEFRFLRRASARWRWLRRTSAKWGWLRRASTRWPWLRHALVRPRPGGATRDITAYRLTSEYGRTGARGAARSGSLSLGTAMSISGAAASPNMGCHTSPAVAFLLTVFNVRLGQWLGNPRRPKKWKGGAPRFGLSCLLSELLAGTNDESGYVYVSDGGHFDNMGLYEMVKRRCGLIIVIDAEEDGGYAFQGLRKAIRMCRVDLGVDIRIGLDALTPAPDTPSAGAAGAPRRSAAHCAVGEIHYEAVDLHARVGTLIYVKASLTGEEPDEIMDYSRRHAAFPHESTADQWFTESQFECYRQLGYHCLTHSLGLLPESVAALTRFGFDTSKLPLPRKVEALTTA